MFSRILLVATLFLSAIPAFSQQIAWFTNLKEAQKEARQKSKPLMYDFTASWCGPCKRMEREFWPRAEVIELSKQFVCVKVDFDKEKGLAGKYGINAIPNVVFADPWGRGLLGQRGFGAGSDTEIFEKIKVLPKDFSSLKEAGDTLEENEKDLNSLHQFAAFYQERKFYWLGTKFYEKLVKLESDASKRESILLNLAFNSLRLGEPGEAIERLQILQKEFPDSPQNDIFLYGLIVANVKKDKMQKATQFFTELKSKFPQSQYIRLAEDSISRLGTEASEREKEGRGLYICRPVPYSG